MQNNFYQKTLPRPLTKEEVYSCLKKIKQGDMEAREKIIIHNLRLVIYIARKYYNTSYDFEELCSVGELGLLKSIDTFDITKNVEFATYATRCINNEILLFMRSGKKYINLDSIDRAIYEDKEGNVLTIMDMLEDLNADFVSASETESIHQEIRQIIDELPPREKKLIMLNFGFINDKVYTQEEIAEMLHISQSYVSRIIKKTLKNLAVKLEQAGIIEKSDWGQKIRGVPKEKVASSTKKVVSENEISKKVAEDILKKKLELEPFFAKNQKNILVKEQALKENQVVDLPQESLVVKEEKKINHSREKIGVAHKKNVQDSAINSLEDYIKKVNLLQSPSFYEVLYSLAVKDIVVIVLRLGVFEGKCFNEERIAKFLGLDLEEVIEIIKKFLWLYQYQNKGCQCASEEAFNYDIAVKVLRKQK